jgi:hypothetical protein
MPIEDQIDTPPPISECQTNVGSPSLNDGGICWCRFIAFGRVPLPNRSIQ